MHYYFSTYWAFFTETCIFQRNTHFFIHRQSTQFSMTFAFANARGSSYLATNHLIILFLLSNAHLMFFQRNVHFRNDTCISQRNTHFALKHAFCDETRISLTAANLPWMHYSNGRFRDISTQCPWQQVGENVDIRKHRLLFALLIDGLSMLTWHAHAQNENIHIPSHTSSRS